MDNTLLTRLVTPRPSAVAGQSVFTYKGENAGIPVGNAPSILNKDYTITAEITVPEGGAEGMIATLGGRFGGYGLFLQKGKPVFVYNFLDLERFRWEGGVRVASFEAAGKHTLVFDFKYDGPGPAKGGTGVLTVDGKEAGKEDDSALDSDRSWPSTRPSILGAIPAPAWTTSYELPFRFTGTIDKLTFKLGPSQMVEMDQTTAANAAGKTKK